MSTTFAKNPMGTRTVWVSGRPRVLSNLNREVQGIKNRSEAGMEAAGLIIKALALPWTPVDTGHLRGGAYSGALKGPSKTWWAEIGYTAEYAPYVHEMNKGYKATGTGWKFLARALVAGKRPVLAVLGKKMKVPGGRRKTRGPQ